MNEGMTARIAIAALVLVPPIVAAYALLGRELDRVWPALVVGLAPAVAILVARVLYRLYAPLQHAALRDGAAEWAQRRIERLGLGGEVVVAALEGEDREHMAGDFYHPPSRVIVLGERVHGEHTVRARAIAAHELGHALMHLRPRLSALLLWGRRQARSLFTAASGLAIGTALAGSTGLVAAVLPLYAAAAALMALVVLDEALASASALRQLAESDDLDRRERRAAAYHLLAAFGTYVVTLLGYVAPLVAWPWLSDLLRAVVPPPAAAAPGGLAASVAWVTGALVLAGGVGAVVSLLPVHEGIGVARALAALLGGLAMFFSVVVAPLFVALVWSQAEPLARPVVVVLAAVPLWEILSLPLIGALGRLERWVNPDEELLVPSELAGASDLTRVSLKALRKKEDEASSRQGAAALLWASARYHLATVPLALVYLF
jgi:Zn-dependent membrane protease YugP